MDYASNSHRSKEALSKQESLEAQNEPRVEQAKLTGGVKLQKKSGFQKFVGTFIAEDATNVKNYLVNDVLIPNAKAAISDVVSNGINMILYGDAAPRRSTSGITNKIQKIQYGGYVNGGQTTASQKRAGAIKNDFDYDNIIFSSRGDAEVVLNNLMDALERYEFVTVAGLYDAAGIETHNYMLNKYGWEDLASARIKRAPDGYVLELPAPKLID